MNNGVFLRAFNVAHKNNFLAGFLKNIITLIGWLDFHWILIIKYRIELEIEFFFQLSAIT